MTEKLREERKRGVWERATGKEREKLSGCLSLSQQPGGCDGQMDNCYFRLPWRKLRQIKSVDSGRTALTQLSTQIVTLPHSFFFSLALTYSTFKCEKYKVTFA